MSIILVLVVLVIMGFLLWLVNTKIPMDATVKSIFNIVAIVFIVLWLLKVFGLLDAITSVKI